MAKKVKDKGHIPDNKFEEETEQEISKLVSEDEDEIVEDVGEEKQTEKKIYQIEYKINDVGYLCHEEAFSLDEAKVQVGDRLAAEGYTFTFIG